MLMPSRPAENGRHVVELAEAPVPPATQLLREHPVHLPRGHRRRGGLQPGERLVVGLGDLRRNHRVEDAQGLADLHRPAFELPEDGEQLLGVLRPHRGRHGVRVAADEPTAPPCGGAASEGQGQGEQLRRAGDLVHVYYYG